MRRHAAVLIAALAMASLAGGACADALVRISSTVTKVDSAGVAIVTLADSLRAYPPLKVTDTIRLSGAPEDLFSGNPQVAIPLRDGRVLLSDRRIVAAFDSAGAFVGVAIPQGRGPGEITTPAGIWQTADDSLWVADISARRISRFSPELRYLRSVEYPRVDGSTALSVFGVLNGDTTAVLEFGMSDPDGPPGMMSVERRVGTWRMGGTAELGGARKFAEVQRFAEGVLPRGFSLGTPYSPTAQWVQYGRCMLFGFPDAWAMQIDAPSSSGHFSPIATLRAPNVVAAEISAERKERFISETIARVPENGELPRAMVERALREHVSFPSRVPSFGRVLVSVDGAIWVQRFRESAAREPDLWTIIDAHGVRAWHLPLPPGTVLLAVRPQGALVATRDADDVESQYWLRLPELADVRLLPSCRVPR